MASAICVSLSLLASQSASAQSNEGFWGGGYRSSSGGSIRLAMQIVEGVGELKADINNWNNLGYGDCSYYFGSAVDGFTKTFLNTAESLESCPDDLGLKLTRQTDNTMLVEFSNAKMLERAELTAGLRPFEDGDRRSPVDSLDILGVRLGMSYDEAAEILTAAGFEESRDSEGLRTSDTYQLRTVVFGRDMKNQVYQDVVAASLTWEPLGKRENGLIKGISRSWTISPDQNLASATLKSALENKYGPSDDRYGETRSFDRSGRLSDSQNYCMKGPLQDLSYAIDGPRGAQASGRTSPQCGPQLQGRVTDDSRTGKATELRLYLADPDLVWKDFWETWSVGEKERIQTILSSVSGATGAAPEL